MVKSFWIFLFLVMHCAVAAQHYKILPLGNSITQSDDSHNSYRYNLWQKLNDEGIDFDFVGNLQAHFGGPRTFPDPTFDQDHEGHWGWFADEIASNLSNWLMFYTPDIVLMHVGSNDAFFNQSVASTRDDLEDIIDILRADNPNVIIFLAQLIPTTYASPGGNNRINALNLEIPNIVADNNTMASPIYLVDQNTGFDPITDTWDGIHPDASGEEKMAEKWFQAMMALVPLPIELLSFAGESSIGKVHLAWSTASEKNNHYFTLEHSHDGKQFYTIEEVKGAGTSVEQLHYNSVHHVPGYGKNYYRLKQTDFDGKFTYSEVIVVHHLEKGEPSMFPIPADHQWFLDFSREEYDERIIQIFDMTGRKLAEYNYIGSSVFELDRNGIADGVYTVRIKSAKHGIIVRKMIFR